MTKNKIDTNIKIQSYPEAFIEENYNFFKICNLGFKTFEQFLAYKWGLYKSTLDFSLGRNRN